MNKLTIIGNLVNDPENRVTTNGDEVCSFRVAVNRRGRDQDADFFRVSAWGERGKLCMQYLAKGRKVCVIGPVTVRAYTDRTGAPAASMEVKAEEIEFLTPRQETAPEKPVERHEDSARGFTAVETDELPF